MLKFHRAKFTNFRALRNVEVSFSDASDQPLTVIRAENRSGKTTMLNALGWVLFGDTVLPDTRQRYRLHPIDWSVPDSGDHVAISGELTLTTDQEDSLTTYRILRSTADVITGHSWKPQPTDISLLRKDDDGWTSVNTPLDTISRLFPASLHHVFLTDGDATLTFIESTEHASQRRTRVQSAVRALLQIDLLENAYKHIKSCRQDFSADLSRTRPNSSDKQILDNMELYRAQRDQLEAQIIDLTDKYSNIELLSNDFQHRYDEAIQRAGGDPARISQNRQKAKEKLDILRVELQSTQESTADFFKYEASATSFASRMLSDMFNSLASRLQSLEESGDIPNIVPSVINDRLRRGSCICGACLDPGTDARNKLEAILTSSEKQSAYSPILVSIHNDLRHWREESDQPVGRLNLLENYEEKMLSVSDGIRDLNNQIREADKQLDSCDLDTLKSLRDDRDQARNEATDLLADLNQKKGELTSLKRQIDSISENHKRLISQTKRGEIAGYRLKAASDLEEVISSTISRLGSETLQKVSQQMHSIFNSMNVSAGEAGASIIQNICLSDDYDIVVMGINGRELKPSTDLSGAQKRALTLSFILSMVKVSGFEAPNIIDTPLGTQSGQFRRNMLEYTCSNSGQLILFLTKDEIVGVEDIIARYCGTYWTLTNKAQQSELVNELPTVFKETLVCNCGIRAECDMCARKPLT